jgi:hypothetical protein
MAYWIGNLRFPRPAEKQFHTLSSPSLSNCLRLLRCWPADWRAAESSSPSRTHRTASRPDYV